MPPLPRRWLSASILLFVLAIALGLLATHSHGLTADGLRFDRALQRHTRSGTLTPVAKGISDVASPKGGLVILAVWCLWLLVRRLPLKAISTFLVIAVGWNIAQVGKVIVERHRPPARFSLDPEIGSNSFPSGHTCFTVAAAMAGYFLARGTRWQRPVAVLGVLAVLAVGFSRLYIGAHYPGDVAGAVLLALAGVGFVCGVWNVWLLPRLSGMSLIARLGRPGAVPPPGAVRGRPAAGADEAARAGSAPAAAPGRGGRHRAR